MKIKSSPLAQHGRADQTDTVALAAVKIKPFGVTAILFFFKFTGRFQAEGLFFPALIGNRVILERGLLAG